MRLLCDYLNEAANQKLGEKLAKILMDELEKTQYEEGFAQNVLEDFLKYLFETTDKDTNIEIGDAINNIYKEYIA